MPVGSRKRMSARGLVTALPLMKFGFFVVVFLQLMSVSLLLVYTSVIVELIVLSTFGM